MATNKKNEKMSREEAGRKGGKDNSKNQGKEFYEEIGKKGGRSSSQRNN